MDSLSILDLYDEHERRNADIPGYSRVETPRTVRMIDSRDGFNFIAWYRFPRERAAEAIGAELEYFRALGRDFEWKTYDHDSPADLPDILGAHGFDVGEDEAIMVLDLAAMPSEWKATTGFDIRRVIDPAGVADMAVVQSAVWPEDGASFADTIGFQLREYPDYVSVYVAYVDGLPVCSSRVNFPSSSPFASLWGGGTVPGYRGRGIYTAMLAVRAMEAVARGYRYLTIDAGPMSRPIVERHGFVRISTSRPCEHKRISADSV